MFLNEKCKNAMNIEDFVEKIKLSLKIFSLQKKMDMQKEFPIFLLKT